MALSDSIPPRKDRRNGYRLGMVARWIVAAGVVGGIGGASFTSLYNQAKIKFLQNEFNSQRDRVIGLQNQIDEIRRLDRNKLYTWGISQKPDQETQCEVGGKKFPPVKGSMITQTPDGSINSSSPTSDIVGGRYRTRTGNPEIDRIYDELFNHAQNGDPSVSCEPYGPRDNLRRLVPGPGPAPGP